MHTGTKIHLFITHTLCMPCIPLVLGKPKKRWFGISFFSAGMFFLVSAVLFAGTPVRVSVPPLTAIPPFLDINNLSPAQYAGGVSFAMESMRFIYGELTSEEEEKFAARWQPLFDHCTPEVVTYFNKLNPLLGQFLGIRAALTEVATAFDEAQLQALGAYAEEDVDSALMAFEEMELLRWQMESLQSAMDACLAKIAELGEPPDAETQRRRRQKLDDEVFGADSTRGKYLILTWGAPPPGWLEVMNARKRDLFLRIRSDEDRHRYLSPEKNWDYLVFESHPLPAKGHLDFRLMDGDFEALESALSGAESIRNLSWNRMSQEQQESLEVLKQNFGYAISRGDDVRVRKFEVAWTRLFGFRALRLDIESGDTPIPGQPPLDRRVDKRWIFHAVDIGLASRGVFLGVVASTEMSYECATRIPAYVDREAYVQAENQRQVARWKAGDALRRREIDDIFDSLEVNGCDIFPSSEEQRPTQEEPRFTDEENDAVYRQIINNGKWLLLGSDTPGSQTSSLRGEHKQVVKANVRLRNGKEEIQRFNMGVEARSEHIWSPFTQEMSAGKSIPFTLGVPQSDFKATQEWKAAGIGPGAKIDDFGGLPGLASWEEVCKHWSPTSGAYKPYEPDFPTAWTGLHMKWANGQWGKDVSRPLGFTEADERAAAVQTFSMPVPDGVLREVLEFQIEISQSPRAGLNTFRMSEDPSKVFNYCYVYDWMPMGWGEEGGDTAEEPDESKGKEDDSAKLAQIEFYENEIALRQNQLGGLERDLARANPASQKEIRRQIMWAKAWIQRARDEISFLQNGIRKRTRTEADAYNFSVMVDQSRAGAERCRVIDRLLYQAPRLIQAARPEDRETLRKFINSQMTPEHIANWDTERFKKVLDAVGDRVIGGREIEAAEAAEGIVDAEEAIAYAESVKWVADKSVFILSFGGGPLTTLQTAYMGATGLIEGGALEAGKSIVASYNSATLMASSAMDAYTQGVLNAYEEHAQDPTQGPVDEMSAGTSAAAWAVGTHVAMSLLSKHVLQPVLGPLLAKKSPPRKKTLKELSMEMQYYKARAEGMDTVGVFRDRLADVQRAAKSGAPVAVIDRLQGDAERAYFLVKTNYHAKLHMNRLARNGNVDIVRHYNAYDHFAMQRVRTSFDIRMNQDGLGGHEYRLYSNSASVGKAAQDIDFGPIEPAPYHVVNGQKVRNPARDLWLANLGRRAPNGEFDPMGLHQFREAGQGHLEGAFREVYGYNPRTSAGREAFLNFTTSDHPEAYKDLAWLGKKGTKTADFENIDPNWAQQASSVTRFKIHEMEHTQPQMAYFSKLQEHCRGTVKDFDTKLLPQLEKGARNPQAAGHMKELRQVMFDFSMDKIGPLEANDRIMILTGGRGMAEVTERYRVMMEGLARMKGKK